MVKEKYLKVIKDPLMYDKDAGMLTYLYRGYRLIKSERFSYQPYSVGKVNFVTLKEAKSYIDDLCIKAGIQYKEYSYFDYDKDIEISVY
jgi:hypothetical protein